MARMPSLFFLLAAECFWDTARDLPALSVAYDDRQEEAGRRCCSLRAVQKRGPTAQRGSATEGV